MDYIHIPTGTRVSSDKELSPALYRLAEQTRKQPRQKKEQTK